MVSLDMFRGLTIASMILVNDPGSWNAVYWPLDHAAWNGWTPTDLVFPFFLFIVGVAMTFSFASRVERGDSRRKLAWHVVRRSATIFAIGLFLNGFPRFHFHTIRIPGVLQRIAVCYLCAGLLYLASRRRETLPDGKIRVRANLAAIGAVAVVLLVGYWAALKFVPVPGFGVGRLDPEGNLGAYIDRAVMGGHLWSQSKTWDPEGILSTFPAVATVLVGIFIGEWLRSDRTGARKAIGMAIAGAVLLIAGRALHPFFPINKKLWTSTFVLFTGGFAMLLLSLFYWLVDLRRWRGWTAPLLAFGTNAIFAFVLADLIAILSIVIHVSDGGERVSLYGWFYEKLFTPYFSAYHASLAFAIFFVLLNLALVWPLYRKRIFIRI